MKPYYEDKWVKIFHGDCREILPSLDVKVDLVLTDPPYESQHLEYGSADLSFLKDIACQQIIFWSARDKFPLDFTAQHIWDKQIGTATQYEMIYEWNGGKSWRVFSFYRMTNKLNASWVDDVLTSHPSQKPQRLFNHLIHELAPDCNLVVDPFLGSGTTCYSAKKLNRYSIGIEIEEKYCEIAAKRCSQEVMELSI